MLWRQGIIAIETYNGTNWTIVTGTDPQNSSYAYIGNVTCTSSTHCVTVGNYIANGINHSLIETYNGTNWTIASGTDPQNSTSSNLSNVTCTSSTHCVAVGTYRDTNNTYYSLIETYDGSSWTVTMSNDIRDSSYPYLSNVTCTSNTSCVAVGATLISTRLTILLFMSSSSVLPPPIRNQAIS